MSNNYALLSIGTNSKTFDDLTISVHLDGEAQWAAVLIPQQTQELLGSLQGLMGQDNPYTFKIALHPIGPTGTESYVSLLQVESIAHDETIH